MIDKFLRIIALATWPIFLLILFENIKKKKKLNIQINIRRDYNNFLQYLSLLKTFWFYFCYCCCLFSTSLFLLLLIKYNNKKKLATKGMSHACAKTTTTTKTNNTLLILLSPIYVFFPSLFWLFWFVF